MSRTNCFYRYTLPAAVLFLFGTIFLLFGETENGANPAAPVLSGRLVPASGEGGLCGYLVAELDLPDGFHIYSVTQPEVPGGYRTAITAENGDASFQAGPFETASPIERVDFLGETLEELTGKVRFIAPITRTGTENAPLPETGWTGTLDALCCDDNQCTPLKKTLTFEAAPGYDTAPLLDAAQKNRPAPAAESVQAVQQVQPVQSAEEAAGGRSLLMNLVLAFLGGLILNVMPCVLPVIGLKIIGFFEQAGQSRSRALTLNGWYAAGILLVFAVLALMSVGLSYLFTYGLFQIVMGSIVFVMALNLMGVWEISLPGFLSGKKSNDLMRREGAFGAVFKGVITTLLAIPCGAPLLSPALVWTDSMIQQGETGLALGVYLVIGLGMASPYLVIGAFPELLRFFPKPGLWMESFRNICGFLLLAAVVWILYSMPLEQMLPTICLLFALWFACWFNGSLPFDASGRKKAFRRIFSVGIAAGTVFFAYNIYIGGKVLNPYTIENGVHGKMVRWAIRADRAGELDQSQWILFSRERLDAELEEGKTVLVDFTADWCMNCKVLESTVLKSGPVDRIIGEKGIVTMTADWTSRDKTPDGRDIGELLRAHGGEQVPVVMIFRPENPKNPEILRGLFTGETLVEYLGK